MLADNQWLSAVRRAAEFVNACATGLPGEYVFYPGGQVSLYASCYAALTCHAIGRVDDLAAEERAAWCAYLNSWQVPASGYYLGPELVPDEFVRPAFDESYLRLHLAVHVLPSLDVLGGRPAHPLGFARTFAGPDYLTHWLEQRDWRRAWLEGNNLLFAGQLLVHLRDREQLPAAQPALDLYFDWLDARQDPATGLWGTNGSCDRYDALYGAYHQLLVYFFCDRPVHYAERIVDVVLSLQQPDGSFSVTPGGGACEDLDAVHVLVNLVHRTGYRLADVRRALSRTVQHLLRQQAPDGGFVYRWGRSYMQSGLLRTFAPANTSDLFSTWFRLHALAVISQVLDEPGLGGVDWRFNPACSMGWQGATASPPEVPDTREDARPSLPGVTKGPNPIRRALARAVRGTISHVPASRVLAWARTLLRWYSPPLGPAGRMQFLTSLGVMLDGMGRESAYELAGGLDVQFWGSQSYHYLVQNLQPGMQVLHLGCGTGSLSYTLASLAGVQVTATDLGLNQVDEAAVRYHHPRLSFVPAGSMVPFQVAPDVVLFTHLVAGKPAWDAWNAVWACYGQGMVLAQLTPHPTSWRELEGTGFSACACSAGAAAALVPAGWAVLDVQTVAAALFACLRVNSAA